MFVVMYDLREMPASHQTFLRQRTFSVPVKREFNGQNNKNQGRVKDEPSATSSIWGQSHGVKLNPHLTIFILAFRA